MDDRREIAWRAALQERGKEWVVSQLRTRPGRPDDIVYDVVFEAPYPTRAFCVQWCAEQENKIVQFSWHVYAAIFMLLLVVVCFWQAVGGWKSHELSVARQQAQSAPAPVTPAQVGSSAANVDVGIPNSYSQPGGSSASSSSGASSSGGNPPSLCNYISYDTTRCPAQQH
jgi:hypothetical protein